MLVFPISRPALGGFIDRIEVDESGLIRIVGWHSGEAEAPAVSVDGRKVQLLQEYRYLRADSAAEGIVWEYLAQEKLSELAVDFRWDGEGVTRFKEEAMFVEPHHSGLLNTEEVLHREHIYGPGPPNESIHPDILAMAYRLKGPVLDFGCGRGVLVQALRARGVEAHGLELNTPIIRACVMPDVTLYNGLFPSPMEEGRFASVICSEVLEHIEDYEGAVKEIARLAGEVALFTVPDASAIPLGYRHGAVPWHLLEGTHVNFFNQASLRRVLTPHFRRIKFGRVGQARFGDTPYWVSLTAWCEK